MKMELWLTGQTDEAVGIPSYLVVAFANNGTSRRQGEAGQPKHCDSLYIYSVTGTAATS